MKDDSRFLTSKVRPDYEQATNPILVVDLFSGCGGLTVGLAEAARAVGRGIYVALAVDFDADISKVYAANFPKARVETCGVEEIFDGGLGEPLTPNEQEWCRRVGPIDVLQGGPPCQGHSDLNNHTRRNDPRNEFYERMARAAEVLRPQVVIIENVPPVRNDRGQVVDRATEALEAAGYSVADAVVSFLGIGVPQRRRRHTVLATRDLDIDAGEVLESLVGGPERDLRWAIGDLEDIDEPEGLDVPSRISPANASRIDWLFENNAYDLDNSKRPVCHQGDHSYLSMYGRLRWNEPAQTMTSGYGSMGQGRYVHPSQPRTLTPHEAARIQFFPDWFDFTAGAAVMKRGTWATMIGNAVPPKLTIELGTLLMPHLR
jgi:DNA (cytosine-5)-methyltransferase 1